MFDRHFKSNHLIQDIAYKHGFNHFPHFIAFLIKNMASHLVNTYHNITQYINDVRLKLCLIDILKVII